MLEAFKPEDESSKDEEFKKIVSELGGKAEEFALNIMRNIPLHGLGADEKEYSVEQVIAEQHNRVMTKDNYRLRNDLDYAYSRESSISILDNYFSSFTAADYPEEWQQIIIKYLHKKLTASVKTDRGLGVGTHHWEERHAERC